jgi:hypothetical protein
VIPEPYGFKGDSWSHGSQRNAENFMRDLCGEGLRLGGMTVLQGLFSCIICLNVPRMFVRQKRLNIRLVSFG